jgi:hypothetical protein
MPRHHCNQWPHGVGNKFKGSVIDIDSHKIFRAKKNTKSTFLSTSTPHRTIPQHGRKRSPMDIRITGATSPPQNNNKWSDAEICDESVDVSVDADTTLYFMNV